MRLLKCGSILLTASIIILSCKSKKEQALSDAKETQQVITSIKPGTIRTTAGGYTMNARIDGKAWVADYVYPPGEASRIVGENKDIGMGLPYDRRDMVVNKKINISHDNAIDLFMPENEGGIMGGYDGEIEITSVNNDWAEGKFRFTATGDGVAPVKVTDGYFRISMKD